MNQEKPHGALRQWVRKHSTALSIVSAIIVLAAYFAKELVAAHLEDRVKEINSARATYDGDFAREEMLTYLTDIKEDVQYLRNEGNVPKESFGGQETLNVQVEQNMALFDDLTRMFLLSPQESNVELMNQIKVERDNVMGRYIARGPGNTPGSLAEMKAPLDHLNMRIDMARQLVNFSTEGRREHYEIALRVTTYAGTALFLVGWGLGLVTVLAKTGKTE